MTGIRLTDLRKTWGAFVAVERLNLSVAPGEFLVLLGPSGCGKTTTMRMIAGLEQPDSGHVAIGDRDVTDLPARDRDVAMVFQNYGLYPHMTVAENIGYPLRLRGMAGRERDDAVHAAAAKVGLETLLARKPRALSGGQRQRVALARAIVRRPTVFLMDEPLSNLDAKLRVSMRAEIKRLHHDLGATVIYVTHDQIEAMTLATRVAVMSEGRIEQLGPPAEIYGDPASRFVAAFVGSPPMNFLMLTRGGGAATIAGQPVALPLPGAGDVELGVRPEDVTVTAPGRGTLDGTVFAVEFTGATTLAAVRVGDALVTATCLPDRPVPDFDARVGLALNPQRLFCFDAATGHRVRV